MDSIYLAQSEVTSSPFSLPLNNNLKKFTYIKILTHIIFPTSI